MNWFEKVALRIYNLTKNVIDAILKMVSRLRTNDEDI